MAYKPYDKLLWNLRNRNEIQIKKKKNEFVETERIKTWNVNDDSENGVGLGPKNDILHYTELRIRIED